VRSFRSASPRRGTYYLRYKDASGKTCHAKVGTTDGISLKDARQQAKSLKAQIELGADPRAEARQKAAVPTFAAFWTEHYQPFAEPRRRTWRNDETM